MIQQVLQKHADNVVQKDLLADIDICIEYFTKLILEHSFDEVQNTGSIDRLCATLREKLSMKKSLIPCYSKLRNSNPPSVLR